MRGTHNSPIVVSMPLEIKDEENRLFVQLTEFSSQSSLSVEIYEDSQSFEDGPLLRSHSRKFTENLGLVALTQGNYYLVVRYDAISDNMKDQLVRFKLDVMKQVLASNLFETDKLMADLVDSMQLCNVHGPDTSLNQVSYLHPLAGNSLNM